MLEIKRVLIATGNSNKLREIQSVASEYDLELLSPTVVREELRLGPWPDVDEKGSSYRENALLKAQAFCEWSGMESLGDDSGLEVLALDGKPGLYSARYGEASFTDSQRIAFLLDEYSRLPAEKQKDNRAVFRCSLALAKPSGDMTFAESELWGRLLSEPRGAGGFGYDPIILIDDIGATLAEVDFSITCQKGFRTAAARKLFSNLFENQSSG